MKILNILNLFLVLLHPVSYSCSGELHHKFKNIEVCPFVQYGLDEKCTVQTYVVVYSVFERVKIYRNLCLHGLCFMQKGNFTSFIQ